MLETTAESQIAALRERRDGALESLVHDYATVLLGAALALGFPSADAEDLVQETFSAFLTALGRFEGRSSLKTFLFGILYNKARQLRSRQAREEASDLEEAQFLSRFDSQGLWIVPPKGPEDSALSDEVKHWVEKCAENLSVDQRAALFLKEMEGQKTPEVCNILGVSATNLRVLLHRARLKMRDCLEKRWEKGK